MMCGCLALTAKKKQWPNPSWSDAIYDKFENWSTTKPKGRSANLPTARK